MLEELLWLLSPPSGAGGKREWVLGIAYAVLARRSGLCAFPPDPRRDRGGSIPPRRSKRLMT